MLDPNENQNSLPEVTLPTDTTPDQVEAINKNSIESETEQSLQSSLASSQDSLANYVDSREESSYNTEKLLDSCHPTSSSTPSSSVSEGINDTIRIANDGDLRASSFNEVTLGNEDVAAQLEGDEKTALEATKLQEELEDKNTEATKLQEELEDKNLEDKNTEATKLKEDLSAKNTEVKSLNEQLNTKNQEIAQLKQQQPNAEVEKLKEDLKAKQEEVATLWKENKELEDKSKTTEQPKQSNAARYTAGIGVGLAAGLIAFTALERTVKLEMLVMIGIAVTSAS